MEKARKINRMTVREMKHKKFYVHEIASELGCSKSTVYRALRETAHMYPQVDHDEYYVPPHSPPPLGRE